MAINKQELIKTGQDFLNNIEESRPKQESLEWYLINNLRKYLEVLNCAETAEQIKSATEKLDMFCIESMDWDTPLFKRCTTLTDLGLKVAKQERE